MSDLNKKLKELRNEDFIWILYIGIIFLSLLSNVYEKDYFINKNNNSKTNYHNLNIIIFSILTIVYLYFLKSSFSSLKSLKENDSYKKKKLTYLSFLGSLLIAFSGFIFLYIALVDNDLDVEIAFN